MHGLIHGATVLSLDGRYPHFILLKPTQPHTRKKVNKRTFRLYSTRHCGYNPISCWKKRKRDAHPRSPGIESFIHGDLLTGPWTLQTQTAFVFTAFSSYGVLWRASVWYLLSVSVPVFPLTGFLNQLPSPAIEFFFKVLISARNYNCCSPARYLLSDKGWRKGRRLRRFVPKYHLEATSD